MTVPSSQLLTTTASEIIADWPAGKEFLASDAIATAGGSHVLPSSVCVELIYEEFCRQEEEGISPDESDFLRRYSAYRVDLLRLFRFHRTIGEVTAPAWPKEGDAFGRYKLTQYLGRGAFSRVFLAVDHALGSRLCVVKVTNRVDGEARILGSLQHPSIVQVENIVDHQSGLCGLVMRYRRALPIPVVFGGDDFPSSGLDADAHVVDAIEKAGLPPDSNQATQLARSDRRWFFQHLVCQVCDGLAAAHRKGICHGDIKPSNVLIAHGGTPMLIDFNLSSETAGTAIGGTRDYFAPEQEAAYCQNATVPLTSATDVYGMGAIAVELMAGGRWFDHKAADTSPHEFRRRLLRPVGERFGEGWRRVLARATASDPSERFRNAEELQVAFARLLRRQQRATRVSQLVKVTAVAASVAVIAGAALWQSPEARVQAAWTSFRHGDDEEAVARIRGMSTEQLEDSEGLLMAGIASLRMAQFREAKTLLESAALSTDCPLAVESLGICLVAQRLDIDRGLELLRYAQARDGANPRVLNNLAYALSLRAKPRDANNMLATADELLPNCPQIAFNLARVEASIAAADSRPARMELLDKAIRLAPNSPGPLWVKATTLLREGTEHWPMAAAVVARAIERGLSDSAIDNLRRSHPEFVDRFGFETSVASTRRSGDPLVEMQERLLLPDAEDVLRVLD